MKIIQEEDENSSADTSSISSEDNYVEEHILAYTESQRNNKEKNAVYLRLISTIHLIFIAISFLFIITFGIFLLLIHHSVDDNDASAIPIIIPITGMAFTVPSALLLTFIRYTLNTNNLYESKIILILFYTCFFSQFGAIFPIYASNGGYNNVSIGGLLSSCLVGTIMSAWTAQSNSIFKDVKMNTYKRIKMVSWCFIAIFVAVPFALLFISLMISNMKDAIENLFTFIFTIFFTSSLSLCRIYSDIHTYRNSKLLNSKDSLHKKRKLLLMITSSIIICATIIYPVSHIGGLILFDQKDGNNNNSNDITIQILIIFIVLGIVVLLGLYTVQRKEVKKYFIWKNRWILFLFYICCIVIPLPFLLPLPILSTLQDNRFFGIFFSMFIFGLMFCIWLSIVVVKLNFHKQHLTKIRNKQKKSQQRNRNTDNKSPVDQPIRRKTTLYNIEPEDRKYFKKIWMIPTITYTVFISYTVPLLITLNLSKSFRTLLLGDDVKQSVETIYFLLFLLIIGIGHLLFHLIFLSNIAWAKQSKWNKLSDFIIYHICFVLPAASIGILNNNDNNMHTNIAIVFTILGTLYFTWSALFHEKINTWKFSPKERLGITGLYILTVVIPTPFISLYWIRYNDTKKIVIPEAVLTYFHVTLVLGILWLCTIRLSYSKFMFQQAAELQKIIIIILAIPGSIPISLMYSYSQDTVSILYLLCTSITAFHLVLILVLMSIYWPKDRVTLGITFAVIYTIFMAIPASVLIYCLLIIPKPSGNEENEMVSLLVVGTMVLMYLLSTVSRPKIKSICGRHIIPLSIYLMFFVIPLSMYPIYPSNLRFIILFVLFGIQALCWEHYDLNYVLKKWKTSMEFRILLCFIYHGLCALPLSLLLVGYEDSVTSNLSGLIFLPFCMLLGACWILFSKLYFLNLIHYKEPYKCLFLVASNACVMLTVMFALQTKYEEGKEYTLECIILVLIPTILLSTFYFQLWKVRFVDKFVFSCVFGVVIPLIIVFDQENNLNNIDSRLYIFLAVAIPASSIILTLVPKLSAISVFQLPTLVNLAISGCFLPFGAILPIYLGFRENNNAPMLNIACILLLITLPLFSILITVYTHYNELYTRVKRIAKKAISEMNSRNDKQNNNMSNIANWISHILMLCSLIFLLITEKYISNEDSSYAIYIIFCIAPIIYILNNRGDTVKVMEKHSLPLKICISMIAITGAIIFAIGHVSETNSLSSIGLTLIIIIPGMFGIYILLRLISMCIHLHPDSQSTMSVLSAFCCIGVFVPFGVVLPSILSTNWKSNETYATLLLFTVSLLALICLLDVSSFTIGVNSTFNTIQKERKAKAATLKLVAVATKHNYCMNTDVARALYDEAFERKHEWEKFEQDIKSERFLQRLQRKKELHLIDAITLKEELANRVYKLCPNCDKKGWKVHIQRRKKLCKACLLAQLLLQKKEIAQRKAQNDALQKMNRKFELDRLEKERNLRQQRKLKYRKCLEQISRKSYDEAYEGLTALIKEDESNADYYCRRSMVLLQLYRMKESLLDATESVSLNPKLAEAYLAKATCLAGLKRWKETVETYKKGISYFPKNKAMAQGLKVAMNSLDVHTSEAGFFNYILEGLRSIRHLFDRANSAIDDVVRKESMKKTSDLLMTGALMKKSINNSRTINNGVESKKEQLYNGCVFRVQVVDIKGLDDAGFTDLNHLTPLSCHIYLSPMIGSKYSMDKKKLRKRFGKQTRKVSDLNNLCWVNEFLFLRWWACKQSKLIINVMGTKNGKSCILASNYVEGHKLGRFSRGNEYVHVPMVLSDSQRFEVGLACKLIEKQKAVHILHSQYNADFLKVHFVRWKKHSLPPKTIRLRVLKEIFTHYSTLKIEVYSKKRRVSSVVIHQLSFQSQMKQLQMQVDQNAKSAKHEWIRGLQKKEENSDDIVVKKSTTVIDNGKMSQKQFDKFVADSMTREYFPAKLFTEKAKQFAKEHHQGGKKRILNNYINYEQFCEIISVIAKRINSSMPLHDALQLLIDENLHTCLPMYTRWRKIHGLRIQSKSSFKIEDPRDVAHKSHMSTWAASFIQRWWRRRQRRIRAVKILQRWYRHRQFLREQYPEKQLNKQLMELMNAKADDDSDDKDNKEEEKSNGDKQVHIPNAFSCIKHLLVPIDANIQDSDEDEKHMEGKSKEKKLEGVGEKDTNGDNNAINKSGKGMKVTKEVSEEEKCSLLIKEINMCRVEWPTIVDKIYPVLEKEISVEIKKLKKLDESEQVVNWNMWDNILTFYVGMMVTAYQYISVALTNGPLAETSEKISNTTELVEESSREQLKQQLQETPWLMRLVDLLIYIPQFKLPEEFGNSFHYFFWFSIVIAIAFPFYSIKGLKALQKGRLGLDKNGRPITKCCTKDGMYNFGLNAVNDYLYFGMMFTLISTYACTYDKGSKEFVLMADDQMKCFTFSEPLQIIYMLVAALGLLGFYPLATLLAPNFQFNNKALDIKYDQSFLIMEHQAELLMAGFSIFYQEDWEKVLVPQFLICLTLSVSNQYIQPCMIKRLNIFRTAVYVCATHACACAIMYNLTSNNSLLTWTTLIIGWLLVWVIVIFIHKRKMKRMILNKVVPLKEVKVLNDPSSTLPDTENNKVKRSDTENTDKLKVEKEENNETAIKAKKDTADETNRRDASKTD